MGRWIKSQRACLSTRSTPARRLWPSSGKISTFSRQGLSRRSTTLGTLKTFGIGSLLRPAQGFKKRCTSEKTSRRILPGHLQPTTAVACHYDGRWPSHLSQLDERVDFFLQEPPCSFFKRRCCFEYYNQSSAP